MRSRARAKRGLIRVGRSGLRVCVIWRVLFGARETPLALPLPLEIISPFAI